MTSKPTSKLKPPFSYYGGKIRMAGQIVDVMRRYQFERYVEPFGGSGAVLFAKEPSKCEVLNDIYGTLTNFYKVLRDPNLYERLIRSIASTPYSRKEYNDASQAFEDNSLDDVERARLFFIVARQSFSSIIGGGWSTPSECSRVTASVSYWRSIDRLPLIHQRLQNVHLENLDAIQCIKKYANENCLLYLDPPYVSETRVAPRVYQHEYTDSQHRELVETLLQVPGHKILSGYEHPIYQPLIDEGWTIERRRMCCHASGMSKKSYRVEALYCSPVRCTTPICTPTMRSKPISKTPNKHPFDRRIFFTRQSDTFFSLNEVRHFIQTGRLSLFDSIFDTDGNQFTANSIVMGKAPRWAMTAEHDPMLYDMPPIAEEQFVAVNELLCEEDFLIMPAEPKEKNVRDFLLHNPMTI